MEMLKEWSWSNEKSKNIYNQLKDSEVKSMEMLIECILSNQNCEYMHNQPKDGQ